MTSNPYSSPQIQPQAYGENASVAGLKRTGIAVALTTNLILVGATAPLILWISRRFFEAIGMNLPYVAAFVLKIHPGFAILLSLSVVVYLVQVRNSDNEKKRVRAIWIATAISITSTLIAVAAVLLPFLSMLGSLK